MQRRLRVSLAALALVCVVPAAVHAQQRQAAQPSSERDDSRPDDIIVEGYRYRPDIETRVRPFGGASTTGNRQSYSFAERLAKCAVRSKLSNRARLRAVVDGEFNTNVHRLAQDRLKRTYITCSETPGALGFTTSESSVLSKMGSMAASGSPDVLAQMASMASPTDRVGGTFDDPAPLGHSIYDRGAFTVQVLKMFAPDLKLTHEQVDDKAVQSRFNLREAPRNRFRSDADLRYFTVAVCMVRVEPKLAVRLAMSDGSASFGDTQAALIDRARVCVGGAKRVEVDPTQFRLYIADAVYRWAVAAHGVDSLIPAD